MLEINRDIVSEYALKRFKDVARYFQEKFASTARLNYRQEHSLNVAQLALTLAKALEANEDICWTAALLHDLGKCYDHSLSEEVNEKRFLDHAHYGALEAREFLEKNNFPPPFIEEVELCIVQHAGLTRETNKKLSPLSAQIVWDADKLSKIGLGAWLHYLAFSSAHGSGETDYLRLIDDHHGIATMEIIMENFNTGLAREMAQARLIKYKEQLKYMKEELLGLR